MKAGLILVRSIPALYSHIADELYSQSLNMILPGQVRFYHNVSLTMPKQTHQSLTTAITDYPWT